MQELSHLELRNIAEHCKMELEDIEEVFAEVRRQYDGTALLDAIGRLESVHTELGKLDETKGKVDRDRLLELTRQRFDAATLRQITKLSRYSFVSLQSGVLQLRRAAEAFGRCIDGISQGSDFMKELEIAIRHTTEALHHAYLSSQPDK